MQRAAADLSGIHADAPDERPWLRHAAWPADQAPLLSPPPLPVPPWTVDDYAFVRVTGEGVHEVPVGPVHAGIIEPGHFRFSIVGEKVLRLEERLGYVHKGIERRFTELAAGDAHRLAARVCGDSAVAYSWAYCQALESLAATIVPPRATALRAVGLELERLQNHLGDLGALGNDAGFAFGLAQFSRLKEELTRAIASAFGQRYLLDLVVPGGVAAVPDAIAGRELGAVVARTASRVRELRGIYGEHAGVRDRFAGAGIVAPELARRLGLAGLAGRASGQSLDLRVDAPWPPYDRFRPKPCGRDDGDVAARVDVRFDEVEESSRLVRALLDDLPEGPERATLASPVEGELGIGLIEGWRGPVLVALELAAGGRIRRCHPHDPSWQNWPVLEHAVIGNIVPDFPLINKSFNLAYSGHDL
ncbi:MAG: Ni,Fe-hydrogenase III large subunit [Proteobacteria bacterium]|nr:Ni,Fe-hydrogenase III large subunit [Pseudomonadota bacterium]